jgi:hypothetical protein
MKRLNVLLCALLPTGETTLLRIGARPGERGQEVALALRWGRIGGLQGLMWIEEEGKPATRLPQS